MVELDAIKNMVDVENTSLVDEKTKLEVRLTSNSKDSDIRIFFY